MTRRAGGAGDTPYARDDRPRGLHGSVAAQRPANAHGAREPRPSAQADAAHVAALGRWIGMLQAQGVNPCDDGLIELRRRRQRLERQQRA